MTFSIHMANIVFHDKPVESNGEAEKIRNDPTSSPHSRGTHRPTERALRVEGIIPAFAGNTMKDTKNGTPFPRVELNSCLRIIPAFAGNTAADPDGDRKGRDHPRIRGEHFFSSVSSRRHQGSSPHSRGTLGTVPSLQ